MNNHERPQDDTIDVKHLFQNSPENLNTGSSPAPSQLSENVTSGNPQAVPQSAPKEQNALDPNYVAPYVQTPPQEPANIQPASPSDDPINTPEPKAPEKVETKISDKEKSEKRHKTLMICICVGVLTVLLGLIGLIIFIASSDGSENPNDNTESIDSSSRIPNNVYAGGIDLSGKTLEQAKNLLHLKTDHTFSSTSMVIRLPGSTVTLPPESTGAKLDVDSVALAALNCGTNGNQSADGTYNINLLDYMTLNSQYIKDTLDTFCQENSSVLTSPVVKLEGTRPQFNPNEISSEYQNQTLVITLGTPEYILDANDMYNQVLDAYANNQLELVYSGPEMIEPNVPDVEDLYEQYCTPAQDAILDMATYEITPEVYGYGFNAESLQQTIDNADYGETISVTFEILRPAILSSDLSKNMFVDTLAEYQNFSNMDDSKRNNNISLSCTALNGCTINAGDTFSFNDVVGKFSTKNGYATAPIDKFNGNAMAGGVTQTASALYVCALVANLDIMERHSHEYAVDFCELGLDAFVDGDANDLRFKNNTNSPIRILAEVTGSRIRIEIVGVNNLDYEVEIVSKVLAETKPMTTYQNMEPNNTLGYVDGDIIQCGINGYKVALYMEKYDRTSGSLISSLEIASSEYAKLDEVVARITPIVTDPSETDPTDPTAPTDPIVTDPTEGTTSQDVTYPTENTPPETTEPTTDTTPPETTEPTMDTTPPETTEPTVDTTPPETTEPTTEAPTEATQPTVETPTETTSPDESAIPDLTIPIPD